MEKSEEPLQAIRDKAKLKMNGNKENSEKVEAVWNLVLQDDSRKGLESSTTGHNPNLIIKEKN